MDALIHLPSLRAVFCALEQLSCWSLCSIVRRTTQKVNGWILNKMAAWYRCCSSPEEGYYELDVWFIRADYECRSTTTMPTAYSPKSIPALKLFDQVQRYLAGSWKYWVLTNQAPRRIAGTCRVAYYAQWNKTVSFFEIKLAYSGSHNHDDKTKHAWLYEKTKILCSL